LIKEVAVTTSRSGARRRVRTGAALVVAVAALAAASACSSGLITQTSNQVAAVPGANAYAYAGDGGEAALLGVMIAYNGPQGYPVGANAPLIVRIFNNGHTTVKLVSASAPGAAARVEKVTDNASPPVEQTPDPSADPSASPAPSEEPTQPPAAGSENLDIEVAPSAYSLLVPGTGAYLQLTDLTAALTPGATVRVTFELEIGAQKTSVEMTVPIAPPQTAAPRVSGDVAGHE
jgi:hypothetical protein